MLALGPVLSWYTHDPISYLCIISHEQKLHVLRSLQSLPFHLRQQQHKLFPWYPPKKLFIKRMYRSFFPVCFLLAISPHPITHRDLQMWLTYSNQLIASASYSKCPWACPQPTWLFTYQRHKSVQEQVQPRFLMPHNSPQHSFISLLEPLFGNQLATKP